MLPAVLRSQSDTWPALIVCACDREGIAKAFLDDEEQALKTNHGLINELNVLVHQAVGSQHIY